ncbi:MAG TPA: aryl-sulfate sulfotransferase, partial [Chthoniobacterales bacterium]
RTASPLILIGQNPGPTPFISVLTLNLNQRSPLQAISFSIAPKPGSVTRAISATYSRAYLLARGYISPGGLQLFLPVFGLYANYANTVTLTSYFSNSFFPVRQQVVIATAPFADPCGFNNRTVIQPRSQSRSLSYDFMLVKSDCGSFSPTILDTDGEIRWAGVLPVSNLPATLFQNALYLANLTTLYRMEFDGTVTVMANYPGVSFNHNIDYGKRGMILDEDIPGQVESFNAEVDSKGNVLKTWNLATIISNAMIAGGDDPSLFVLPFPTDWFHNNATVYRKSDNSLIVSSRENFVIALDYDTGAIKWILGDPTKQWYQFASLRKYALALAPGTVPPIGQHAVSFTADDRLLLFDDGQNSQNHVPPGQQLTYSAPRKYNLNLTTGVATEVWNYTNNQSLFTPYCGSTYEDSPSNYLVDYALITNLGANTYAELLGLDATEAKIFDYRYATVNCNTAWNSIPIHMENLKFTAVAGSSLAPGSAAEVENSGITSSPR